MSLSAQMPWTSISFLSSNAIFLSTVSVLSLDLSDRRKTVSARATERSRRLAGEESRHFFLQSKIVTMKNQKHRSSPAMTPPSSFGLERNASTRTARLEFVLLSATLPSKRSCKSCRKEGLKRVKTVIASESEKGIRY